MYKNVKIIATGSYTPEHILSNIELESRVNTSSEWIFDNLGILERRVASSTECTSDLARIACERAIAKSNIDKNTIELIIVATATPDRLAPSTATILQDKLGLYNAAAFDIAAVCSGFLFAMSVANQYISCGTYKTILVVGADTFSKITDWEKRDSVFFGDGAGAAILSVRESNGGFNGFRLYSDGRGKDNFTIPAGGSEFPASTTTIENKQHYFKMNGRAVYDTATHVLPIAINQVLVDSNMNIDQIKLMIPHQPSIRILQQTAKKINLPWEKVMTNMDKYANTSGATIPILLDEVYSTGKINDGDIILFAAVGSGWTYGAAIFTW